MVSPGFNKRLQDLEDNISKIQALLKDFEDALLYETNPKIKAGYRRDIENLRESVADYRQEYKQLQQQQTGQSPERMQEVEKQLRQMDEKLDDLQSGQQVLYISLGQMRQMLVERYDTGEKVIIDAIAQQLNEKQLLLTQELLNAVETNQVSQPQMQEMLAVLEEQVPSLPTIEASAIEILKDPKLDTKHKLKFTIPLVPLLLNYEGEFELGSGFNIKSVWETLRTKLQRNEARSI